MAFVQAIVRAYEARQMSALGALEKAQIPPDLIDDADERITALQMEALSDAAMRELDDEALGWFERRLPWGSYGMLARASISAPQLGLALARWCRHHGLIAQDIQLQLSEQAGIATLTLHESRPLGGMREFCMVSVLRNIHGFASWLINEPISLLHASFPFSEPAHADVYKVLFAPGSIAFDAPVASLQFEARWLQAPLARDEAALNRMLQRALPIQVRPYQREKTLVQRVRHLLAASGESSRRLKRCPASCICRSAACTASSRKKVFRCRPSRTISGVNARLRCCCAPAAPSSAWPRPAAFSTTKALSAPFASGQGCPLRNFAKPPASVPSDARNSPCRNPQKTGRQSLMGYGHSAITSAMQG
jgi:hypothetical protein